MRTEKEIKECIQSHKNGLEKLRESKHKYRDENVYYGMIAEFQHIIHTLEWVLGEHERFD